MERAATIQADASVDVGTKQARQWFLDLETHPERYQFETHAGFTFTAGNFGQIGAHFQTWEQFHGLQANLHFELTKTSDHYFRFRLLRPPLPIWCAFAIEERSADSTNLSLEVGGTTALGTWLLRLPLIKGTIRRQIQAEVDHIKASIEAIYGRSKP
ncbi:MAG: hypothetical protein AB8I69_11315 [Anaerolineae bacterium]|jgi:hypothetical protein